MRSEYFIRNTFFSLWHNWCNLVYSTNSIGGISGRICRQVTGVGYLWTLLLSIALSILGRKSGHHLPIWRDGIVLSVFKIEIAINKKFRKRGNIREDSSFNTFSNSRYWNHAVAFDNRSTRCSLHQSWGKRVLKNEIYVKHNYIIYTTSHNRTYFFFNKINPII